MAELEERRLLALKALALAGGIAAFAAAWLASCALGSALAAACAALPWA